MASRKAFSQCLVLLILLMNCFAFLVQCGRPHNTKGEHLVTATCKHTLHFQVCNSSLRPVPSSSKTSDLKVLAEIALNLNTTYDSKEALANGDCDRVDTLVSTSMSDAETCEDGFKDMPSEDNYSTSPLTEHNRYFS
ncbi:hypothetical protein VNO80_21344 [Phaseolus coccineus]|uniref:Pectinesterase inhibitor domain-containing protein n=1 Tax=Phaseolus coccineus TaxID=3886 RepID=A0AAN9QU00_PHACN